MNTKAKLEQCQADIAKITAERDGLQAELDEPELRHGELRCWTGTAKPNHFIVDLSDEDKGPHCLWVNEDLRNRHSKERILNSSAHVSYIFDDLERNSKDLEKFEVKSTHFHGKFKRKLEFIMVRPHETGCVNIYGENSKDYGTFEREDIIEIYQKLGQLIATAKRRQNAK